MTSKLKKSYFILGAGAIILSAFAIVYFNHLPPPKTIAPVEQKPAGILYRSVPPPEGESPAPPEPPPPAPESPPSEPPPSPPTPPSPREPDSDPDSAEVMGQADEALGAGPDMQPTWGLWPPVSGVNLKAVYAVAPDNVWAAGATTDGLRGVIFRFDGGQWVRAASHPIWPGLNGIWMSPVQGVTQSGWAVGDQGMILRCGGNCQQGTSWHLVQLQPELTRSDLLAFAGFDASTYGGGWIVGKNGTILRGEWSTGQPDGRWTKISEWNRDTNQCMTTSCPTSREIRSIWRIDERNLWAAGGSDEEADPSIGKGRILHYSERGWEVFDDSPAYPLNAIAGVNSNMFWTVGESDGTQALILQYINQVDSQWESPTSKALRGLVLLAPNNIWAVGGSGTDTPRGRLLHSDGSTWEVANLRDGSTPTYTLNAIAAVPNSSEMWAVGETGTILRYGLDSGVDIINPYVGDSDSARQIGYTIRDLQPVTVEARTRGINPDGMILQFSYARRNAPAYIQIAEIRGEPNRTTYQVPWQIRDLGETGPPSSPDDFYVLSVRARERTGRAYTSEIRVRVDRGSGITLQPVPAIRIAGGDAISGLYAQALDDVNNPARPGQALRIEISGQGLNANTTVGINAPGVTTYDTTFEGGKIRSTIYISPQTPPGFYGITLVNERGIYVRENVIRIGAADDYRPVIESVSPWYTYDGWTPLTISGPNVAQLRQGSYFWFEGNVQLLKSDLTAIPVDPIGYPYVRFTADRANSSFGPVGGFIAFPQVRRPELYGLYFIKLTRTRGSGEPASTYSSYFPFMIRSGSMPPFTINRVVRLDRSQNPDSAKEGETVDVNITGSNLQSPLFFASALGLKLNTSVGIGNVRVQPDGQQMTATLRIAEPRLYGPPIFYGESGIFYGPQVGYANRTRSSDQRAVTQFYIEPLIEPERERLPLEAPRILEVRRPQNPVSGQAPLGSVRVWDAVGVRTVEFFVKLNNQIVRFGVQSFPRNSCNGNPSSPDSGCWIYPQINTENDLRYPYDHVPLPEGPYDIKIVVSNGYQPPTELISTDHFRIARLLFSPQSVTGVQPRNSLYINYPPAAGQKLHIRYSCYANQNPRSPCDFSTIYTRCNWVNNSSQISIGPDIPTLEPLQGNIRAKYFIREIAYTPASPLADEIRQGDRTVGCQINRQDVNWISFYNPQPGFEIAPQPDTTPPTATIESPAPPPDPPIVSGLVTIRATVQDRRMPDQWTSGVAQVRFYFKQAGSDGLGTEITPFVQYPFYGLCVESPCTVERNWNTSGLANGRYTLTVRATDGAGNVTTVQRDVCVGSCGPAGSDTPQVSITAPEAGDVRGQVIITMTVSGTNPINRVEFLYRDTADHSIQARDLSLSCTSSCTVSTDPPRWDTTAVANGPYTIIVKARNQAGLWSAGAERSVTISNPPRSHFVCHGVTCVSEECSGPGPCANQCTVGQPCGAQGPDCDATIQPWDEPGL